MKTHWQAQIENRQNPYALYTLWKWVLCRKNSLAVHSGSGYRGQGWVGGPPKGLQLGLAQGTESAHSWEALFVLSSCALFCFCLQLLIWRIFALHLERWELSCWSLLMHLRFDLRAEKRPVGPYLSCGRKGKFCAIQVDAQNSPSRLESWKNYEGKLCKFQDDAKKYLWNRWKHYFCKCFGATQRFRLSASGHAQNR